MAQIDETVAGVVIINDSNGHSVVERDSSLKRLHYFDGKFLRAPDLQLEQNAILNRIRVSNQAGGSGIVHGLSCLLQGNDTIRVTPGLAFDPQGRVLQLGNQVDVSITDLIERASSSGKGRCECEDGNFGDCEKVTESGEADTVLDNETLYLIVLHYIEAYCGEEDVYGQLCETACVSSTQRPYILPGIELRAVPLSLDDLKQSPLISAKHLRSRVASAYFEMERQQVTSQISKTGLANDIWCLGAEAAGGNGVPVAMIGRGGGQTLFLDAWSARRERMESPPRHYWAYRMAMRPWQVFLAQVLQFQCQLSHCIGKGGDVADDDPCADERAAAAKVAEDLKQLMQRLEHSAEGIEKNAPQMMQMMPQLNVAGIQDSYQLLVDIARPSLKLPTRWLIDCGIVELPSGGYLPVDKESSVSVNDQVQRMMGEGVDLRFCVVRPDYIPHALEEAQHMERICLLKGIDNPDAKPQVDVLVPEGEYEVYEPETPGTGYEMVISGPREDELTDLPGNIKVMSLDSILQRHVRTKSKDGRDEVRQVMGADDEQPTIDYQRDALQGAARGEILGSGGYAFYFAGRMPPLVRGLAQLAARPMRVQTMAHSVHHEIDDATADEYLKEIKNRHYEAEKKEDGLEEIVVEAPDNKEKETNYDMWLNLRCDRDPFNLNRGESSNVSLELTLLVEASLGRHSLAFVIEFTQMGSLVIEEVLQGPPEANLRARLSSNGMMNTTTLMSGQRKEKAKSMRIDEQIFLKRAPGSQLGFIISVPSLSFFNKWDNENLDLDLGLHFERQWVSANEAQFNASMSFSIEAGDLDKEKEKESEKEKERGANSEHFKQHAHAVHGYQTRQHYSQSRTVELLNGRQIINPDSMKPDHWLHDTSLVALGEIGQALDDDGFADSRARLLLPMPEQLRVFARHNWVMFHRRRDIECGYAAPDQVASKPRRYRLLLVDTLKSREQLQDYYSALRNNHGDIIQRYGYRDAGTVEFEAGLQTLLTAHGGLRSTWDSMVHGKQPVVMLGAIASRGAAYDEGATLANLRLQRLSDVLAPVTPLDEEGRLTLLDQVPDVLAEGDRDGVIVMVVATPEQSATVCHEVYRVALDPKETGRLEAMLAKDANEVLNGLKNDYFPLTVSFNSGQSTLRAESEHNLLTQWDEAVPHSGFLLVSPQLSAGHGAAGQPLEEQSTSILKAVSGDATEIGKIQPLSSENLSTDCIAVTVLLVDKNYLGIAESHYAMLASRGSASAGSETEAASKGAMQALMKNLSFNGSGEVESKDEFEATLKHMKEAGMKWESIEVVKADESKVSAKEKARAEVLLTRLKAEGLAGEDAKVKTRKPSVDEKIHMLDSQHKIAGGFVLRAVAAGHDPME